MKTAIIYVFSGTFNTLHSARMIAHAFREGGVETTVCEIRKPLDALPSPEAYDCIGFGYPVHAYNAPEFFVRFLKQLPDLQRPAFLFKTSGEPFKMNNASSCVVHALLKRKGYDVLLESHMLMPYNVMFRYQDALAKQMYLYTQAQSKLLVLRLLNGERDAIRYHVGHHLVAFLMRIEWFGARFNGLLYSVNKTRCTRCRRCVSMCPVGNIRMDDKGVRFGAQCAMCMRCAMYCPHDAINVGLLQFWKVYGGYEFKRILADAAIPADFVREDTQGYFRMFRKYYRKADAELAKHGLRAETMPAINIAANDDTAAQEESAAAT